MADKLAEEELLAASKNEGNAITEEARHASHGGSEPRIRALCTVIVCNCDKQKKWSGNGLFF